MRSGNEVPAAAPRSTTSEARKGGSGSSATGRSGSSSGAGVGGALLGNAKPHSQQNFAPAGFLAPQLGQGFPPGASAPPFAGRKRAFSAVGSGRLPQPRGRPACGATARGGGSSCDPSGAPQWAQRFAPGSLYDSHLRQTSPRDPDRSPSSAPAACPAAGSTSAAPPPSNLWQRRQASAVRAFSAPQAEHT